jgi:hypothetical protein
MPYPFAFSVGGCFALMHSDSFQPNLRFHTLVGVGLRKGVVAKPIALLK